MLVPSQDVNRAALYGQHLRFVGEAQDLTLGVEALEVPADAIRGTARGLDAHFERVADFV
jgi:hypothetical protein